MSDNDLASPNATALVARPAMPLMADSPGRAYGYSGFQPPSEGGNADAFLVAFSEYLRTLRRYKWFILAVVCVALLVGGARTIMATRLYMATVRLQIDRSVSKIVEGGNVMPAETNDFEFMRTQYELLQSRGVAERAVILADLADDPSFTAPASPTLLSRVRRLFGHDEARPVLNRTAIERAATGRVLGNRTVRPVSGSRLVDIAYTDDVPARARAVAMGLAEGFIASNLDKRIQANSYAKTFLDDRIQQLKVKLQDSERALLDFGQKEQIVQTNEKGSIAENNLSAASVALGNIVTERIRNEQQYRQVDGTTAMNLPQFLSNKVIEGLRERRNALVTDYQDKLETLKPSYPEMVSINNKIKEIDRQLAGEAAAIKASLKGAFEASRSQEEQMRKQIDSLRADVLDVQKRSIQYNILKRESDSNRVLYEGLLQRYKEVDVAGGSGSNNVFIVDTAEVPSSPFSPSVTSNLALSLLGGLVLGLAGAFVLDRLDNTVTVLDEVERLTGLPTLGIIPKVAHDTDIGEEIRKVSSGVAEAYRTLCTSLQLATDNGMPSSVLITSSEASEGKSTTAIAVASYFAKIGLRVLIVDADLRKPSLHTKLNLDRTSGLTNYLTGSATLQDIMQPTTSPNLSFIASGPLPPNASELLASPRMVSLFSSVAETFDLLVVDGPPILGLADAQLLSSAAATTLFVLACGATPKHAIRSSLKRLRFSRANVIGSVLTRYDSRRDTYGYQYGYGQYYQYNYGHSRPSDEVLPAPESQAQKKIATDGQAPAPAREEVR